MLNKDVGRNLNFFCKKGILFIIMLKLYFKGGWSLLFLDSSGFFMLALGMRVIMSWVRVIMSWVRVIMSRVRVIMSWMRAAFMMNRGCICRLFYLFSWLSFL